MPYPFKQIFAVDPNNSDVVAKDSVVLIFTPGDGTRTPLAITDLTGAPMPNPVPTNEFGFAPAFMADIPQVAWEGAGFTNTMESYEGMRDEAVIAAEAASAAQQAVDLSATAAMDAASSAAEQVATELGAAVTAAQQSAVDAAAAAQLVGAPADVAVRTLVGSPDTETAAALKATFAPKPASLIDRLKQPLFISHRGGPTIYPESSMEGFRASLEAGFLPEMDVQALQDGTLVVIHDATVERTMTGINPGRVDNKILAEWNKGRIKPAVSGGREALPVTFDQVLDELGGRGVLVPQLGVYEQQHINSFINAIVSRGLQGSILAQSFDLGVCQQFLAAGITPLLLIMPADTTDAATIKAAGIKYVAPSKDASAAYVNSLTLAGLIVTPYTVNTQAQWDDQKTKGVHGVITDDPWYWSGRMVAQTADPFAKGYGWPRIKGTAASTDAATLVNYPPRLAGDAIDFYRPSGLGTSTLNKAVYCDWAGPITLPVQISMRIFFGRTHGLQTDHAGFSLHHSTTGGDWIDGAAPGQSGFTFIARRNGTITAYKRTAGANNVQLAVTTAVAEFAPQNKTGMIDLVVKMLDNGTITVDCPQDKSSMVINDLFNPGPMRLVLQCRNQMEAKISDVNISRFS